MGETLTCVTARFLRRSPLVTIVLPRRRPVMKRVTLLLCACTMVGCAGSIEEQEPSTPADMPRPGAPPTAQPPGPGQTPGQPPSMMPAEDRPGPMPPRRLTRDELN